MSINRGRWAYPGITNIVRFPMRRSSSAFFGVLTFVALVASATAATEWAANDAAFFKRSGEWAWTSHRYAAESALVTKQPGAALEFSFHGRAAVLELDTLTPPNHFGPPELGALAVYLDDVLVRLVRPRIEDHEVVLHRSAELETHRVRLVHQAEDVGVGVRVRGVRILEEPTGDLQLTVSGEQHGALIDVRVLVTQGGKTIRRTLVRNWLTGQCRLAGLPPGDGYTLELTAAGWKGVYFTNISVAAGKETTLAPVYLIREWDAPVDDFKSPALGHPVIRRPGDSLRARFEGHQRQIRDVRIVRLVGPATISRVCGFVEDQAAAFYYHREGTVTLPADTPPGVYDLEVSLTGARGDEIIRSRRSVVVVEDYTREPTFVAFGHLDTWGQYQAEYVHALAEIANLLAPDLVLISNEANPAYAAGALYHLDVPYIINFGNHRAPDPGPWYGQTVDIVDFGTAFTVLNFGEAWDADTTKAEKLLADRHATRIKLINAFEANAPIAGLLDRFGVALIHYAHGPGPAVARLGQTPTVRVGKVNSESFRVIRFQDGKPVQFTYRDHATAAIPFRRNERPPLRVHFDGPNDGTRHAARAEVTNDLEETFPRARVVFVMTPGNYDIFGGQLERAIESDDGRYRIISVRCDLPAKASVQVSVRRR